MEILKLAINGILRKTSRSIPVILIVATAVFSAHIVVGFIQGTQDGLKFGIVYGGTGHMQIAQPGQFKGYTDGGINHTISPVELAKITALLEQDQVRYYAQLSAGGLASNGEKTVPFSGLGVEIEADTSLRRIVTPIIAGTGLRQSKKDEFRATIGQTLAEQLSMGVGDSITLLTPTKHNAINAIDLIVVGLVSTGNRFSDAVFVQMPMENMQYLLDTEDISRVIVFDESADDIGLRATILQDKIGGEIVVKTWRDVEPIFDQIKKSNRAQFLVLSAMLAIVIFISLVSVITNSIFERQNQIGVLRALGMRRSKVYCLFTVEAIVLGMIGVAIGLSLSWLAILYLKSASIMLPPPPGQISQVPLIIYWDPKMVPLIVMVVAIIAAFAALASVRRLSTQRINEMIERS